MSLVEKVTRKSMIIRPSGRSTDYIKEILTIFVVWLEFIKYSVK